MKRQFNLIVALVICTLLQINCSKVPTSPGHVGKVSSGRKFTITDNYYVEMDASSVERFCINGLNGVIRVRQEPGASQLKVSAVKLVKAETNSMAERHLNDLDVLVQDENNAVYVSTLQPEKTGDSEYCVNYTISMPESISLTINNGNGDIFLEDIQSHIKVEVENGDIRGKVLSELNSCVDMYTDVGSISLSLPNDICAEFHARVNIGTITVENLNLDDIEETADYIFGTANKGSGSVLLETQVGNITATGF